MSDPNLVTTYNFNNRDYFIKMHVNNNILELVITDKQTGEDWQCCYDAAYIENITQKTGNFKQFTIFIAMLKSGLLKTSNSVYLDLMTFEDLDVLRNHRIRGPYSVYHTTQTNSNKRYLILTYTVEFDRIHYPLPLEYCGPPDPQILQQNIVKLEDEIVHLKDQIKTTRHCKQNVKEISGMEKKIEDLIEENVKLRNENVRLTNILAKKSKNKEYISMLQNAIKNLEKSVLSERKSHHKLVEKLRKDKLVLSRELDKIKLSEKALLGRLQSSENTRGKAMKKIIDSGAKGDSRSPSPKTNRSNSWEARKQFKVQKRPARSRSKNSSDSEFSGREFQIKPNGLKIQCSRSRSTSSGSSCSSRSSKNHASTFRSQQMTPQRVKSKSTDLDFGSLENRILSLQKMLHKGLNLT